MFGAGMCAAQAEGGFNEGGKGISIPDLHKAVSPDKRKEHCQLNERDIEAYMQDTNHDLYPKRKAIDLSLIHILSALKLVYSAAFAA